MIKQMWAMQGLADKLIKSEGVKISEGKICLFFAHVFFGKVSFAFRGFRDWI